MSRFNGKTVVITGASSGIGEACARKFVSEGARVVLAARSKEPLDRLAAELGGAVTEAVPTDISDVAQCKHLLQQAVSRFGSVDILVNNAGTNPAAGNLTDVDLGAVGKTWEVNQLGPLLWSRSAWRHSMAETGGAIVNIASVGGMRVGPVIGAYNISKAAVIHMTYHLANEMAPLVRVNAVAPSVVRTRLAAALWEGIEEQTARAHPLQRIGEPDDIAKAVLFLASDAASWITGVVLPVDGGVTGAAASPGLGG